MFYPSYPALDNKCCTKPVANKGFWHCTNKFSQMLQTKPNPLLKALQKGKSWP